MKAQELLVEVVDGLDNIEELVENREEVDFNKEFSYLRKKLMEASHELDKVVGSGTDSTPQASGELEEPRPYAYQLDSIVPIPRELRQATNSLSRGLYWTGIGGDSSSTESSSNEVRSEADIDPDTGEEVPPQANESITISGFGPSGRVVMTYFYNFTRLNRPHQRRLVELPPSVVERILSWFSENARIRESVVDVCSYVHGCINGEFSYFDVSPFMLLLEDDYIPACRVRGNFTETTELVLNYEHLFPFESAEHDLHPLDRLSHALNLAHTRRFNEEQTQAFLTSMRMWFEGLPNDLGIPSNNRRAITAENISNVLESLIGFSEGILDGPNTTEDEPDESTD